jgi:hypothetical protein
MTSARISSTVDCRSTTYALHVMGDAAPADWFEDLDERPSDGQIITHNGKSYFVIRAMGEDPRSPTITLIPKVSGATV